MLSLAKEVAEAATLEVTTQEELWQAESNAEGSKYRVAELEKMVTKLQGELAHCISIEEDQKKQWEVSFRTSSIFLEKVKAWAYSFFKLGFKNCIKKFRAMGYPLAEVDTSFLDLKSTLAQVPPEYFEFKP